jgi:hypothetical protein
VATVTKIVIGRVGDALVSPATVVTDEHFTSAFDTWVNAAYANFDVYSVLVRATNNLTTYTLGTDYQINYLGGAIKVLSTGTMVDATEYHVSYIYPDGGLASKINAITSAAQTAGKTIYKVATTRISPQMGVAVIVYQA